MRVSTSNYINEIELIYTYLTTKWLGFCEVECYFGDIGFKLETKNAMREEYTPDSVDIFASTWWESVHFGINRKTRQVNITVPWWNINNVIIANSFEDFIQIWSKYGFFPLEQIAYDLNDILYYYHWYEANFDGNKVNLEIFPHEKKLLQELRQVYNYDIKKVDDIKQYLYRINDWNKEVIDFFNSCN